MDLGAHACNLCAMGNRGRMLVGIVDYHPGFWSCEWPCINGIKQSDKESWRVGLLFCCPLPTCKHLNTHTHMCVYATGMCTHTHKIKIRREREKKTWWYLSVILHSGRWGRGIKNLGQLGLHSKILFPFPPRVCKSWVPTIVPLTPCDTGCPRECSSVSGRVDKRRQIYYLQLYL